MTAEEWRPVVGLEGRYEVSDQGRIKSLNYRRSGKPGILKLAANTTGYLYFRAGRNDRNRFVHVTVMRSFVGPRPDPKMHIRHLNGERTNNWLSNLCYGTASENMFDRARLGEDHNSIRSHCKNGHPFDDENTYMRADGGGRGCRTCRRRWTRECYHRTHLARQERAA